MEGARMNTRYMFRHNTGTEQGASRKRVGPAEQERASGLKLQKSLCTHRQLTSLQKVIQLQHKQKKKKSIFLGKFEEKLLEGNIPNERTNAESVAKLPHFEGGSHSCCIKSNSACNSVTPCICFPDFSLQIQISFERKHLAIFPQ